MPRVLILMLILFLTNVPLCSAEVPELFREPSFNAATLAIAVNHFVAIGEEATVKELATLSVGKEFVEVHPAAKPRAAVVDAPPNYGWISIHERIGWVCRALFVPKGREPLRPPAYGALWVLPYGSMPLGRWPLFPVALSGSTYFVLSEGYALDGRAELAMDYVAYSRENGIFRRTPVQVPTREQAMKDAAALRQSEAWRAIKWPNSSPVDNERLRDEVIGKFIQAQAESVPIQRSQRLAVVASPHLTSAAPCLRGSSLAGQRMRLSYHDSPSLPRVLPGTRLSPPRPPAKRRPVDTHCDLLLADDAWRDDSCHLVHPRYLRQLPSDEAPRCGGAYSPAAFRTAA
jgi:hypothetical protein